MSDIFAEREPWIDTSSTDEIVCPYCGHEFTESFDYRISEWGEDVSCQNEECGKTFRAISEISVTYSSWVKK